MGVKEIGKKNCQISLAIFWLYYIRTLVYIALICIVSDEELFYNNR
jgi:hypothetical protein